MKISIVMAYFNRVNQIKNTLRSILESIHKSEVEVVIVDDASRDDHRLESIVCDFDLNIKLIRIEPSDKKWVNACVPFNIGFKNASGDLIIFQNPECIHVGDIISISRNLIRSNLYLNFGCYSTDKVTSEKLASLTKFDINCVRSILDPMVNRAAITDGENAWYNHPTYRPSGFHFCSAILRDDLIDLGGFDERYSQGVAYDDNDLIARIQRKKMDVTMTFEPFVIHQFHETAPFNKNENLILQNKLLFEDMLAKSEGYKAVIGAF
jgi:glycosyltransferase involved in cell wall biosynthesis